ncbi:hypothetical protein CEXT_342941 [Caerostris extrusa]|uniref:Uncharacterized protein n=1 Tax=Caerostris extrusa TaxID=172846 RepID=A0AAV4SC69_CAEEX|nr:hypothetical protein CEXT_342941 [Caerostris extrusa]
MTVEKTKPNPSSLHHKQRKRLETPFLHLAGNSRLSHQMWPLPITTCFSRCLKYFPSITLIITKMSKMASPQKMYDFSGRASTIREMGKMCD